MPWLRRILAACVLVLACASLSSAQAPGRRVALVIGNGAYAAAPRLANPPRDAALIERTLARAGFQTVSIRTDLGRAAFEQALREFTRQAEGAEVALLYYAGHGMEMSGRNWLIPVDAQLADERDLSYEAVDLDRVLSAVEGARGLRLVLLDACRDNPFTRSMRRLGTTRNLVTRGLADIEVTGTMVVYAARAGSVSYDGTGGNSPFATALARRLPQPGTDIRILMSQVRDDVLAATARRQEPFQYGSLPGVELYLVPPASSRQDAGAPSPPVSRPSEPTTTLASSNPCAAADAEWARLRGSSDRAALEAFVRDTSAGCNARGQANARLIELLRRQDAAIGVPPGQEFDDCAGAGWCPRMVVIPAGSFTMGSPASEPGREANEGPQRRVNMRAFAVSKYEITFAQWDACVAGGGCGGHRPNDQSWGRGNLPVINVSWDDAQSYVTWINGRVGGQRYRLLTEAEWEYAARAGATTAFSWGDAITPRQAQYYWGSSYRGSPTQTSPGRTAAVGSCQANAFGLHDMHGNVLEWVQDCWESYAGAPNDGSAVETSNCSRRVLRGGSWYNYPQDLRSAIRSGVDPTVRDLSLGFRLARIASPR